jgi:hypothetical protein
MPRQFSPVMRRAPILTDHVEESFNEALLKFENLRCISISLWVDGEQALPCLAPYFLMQTDPLIETVSWKKMKERGEADLSLAKLAMDLMSDNAMHSRLEAVTASLPIGIGQHFVEVDILPNSIIIHHSDMSALVNDNHAYFAAEPEKETTIAPLCTVILKTNQTAHEVIEEAQSLSLDLSIFRDRASDALNELDWVHQLTLADPTTKDLQSVKTLDIH